MNAVAVARRSHAMSDKTMRRLFSMLRRKATKEGNIAAAEALIRLRLVTEGVREPEPVPTVQPGSDPK
jgi:hypothetical protein